MKILFCISILLGLLNAIASDSDVFMNMTLVARQDFFENDDGSIPEHEIVDVELPSRSKRSGEEPVTITFSAFGDFLTTTLYAVEDHNVISRGLTGIWNAKRNQRAYQNIVYAPSPSIFDEIGEIKFYQNVKEGSAITRFRDSNGNEHIMGILKQNYTAKSVPREYENTFIDISRKHTIERRSVNSANDQHEKRLPVVVFKNNGVEEKYVRQHNYAKNGALPNVHSLRVRRESTNPIEVPDVPDTEVPDVPDTEVPDVPVTEVPDVPITEVPDVPITEVPDVPVTDVPDVPVTDLPDVPVTEVPDVPEIKVPDVVYPKLLLIIEANVLTRYGNHIDFLKQLIARFNSIDMLFRQLKSPEVRLSVTGIIIAEDDASTPYITRHTAPDGRINGDAVIYEAQKYFANEPRRFARDRWDSAVIFTTNPIGTRFDGGDLSIVDGLSWLGRGCAGSAAIAKFSEKMKSVYTLAHELGHLFGVSHDDVEDASEKCNDADGYLTANGYGSAEKLNWSACSRAAFQNYFSSDAGNCTHERPEKVPEEVESMPGAWLPMAGQCDNIHNDAEDFCKSSEGCSGFGCVRNGTCYWLLYPAMEGSMTSDDNGRKQACVNRKWISV